VRKASSRHLLSDTGHLPYHGKMGARLSVASLFSAPVAAGLIAMLLGGCSMQLSSLLPGGVSDTGPTVIRSTPASDDTTGSIPLHMASARDIPMGMSAIDWPHAQAALRDALDPRPTKDAKPALGQSGRPAPAATVTPLASALHQRRPEPAGTSSPATCKDGSNEGWSAGRSLPRERPGRRLADPRHEALEAQLTAAHARPL
jgi:hypothetical protein